MKNYTDITFVLDRSGSMHSIASDTKGGFDKFIEDQKNSGNQIKFSLVQFDDHYESIYSAVDIQNVGPLEFNPRGSTALLDAIGRTINETGVRLKKLSESERPNKVLFVIMTDGHENASHEFSNQKISEMIKHQESNYQWQFVFMGANQDSFATAGAYSIMRTSAINFHATSAGITDAYNVLSSSTRSYCAGKDAVSTNFFDGKENASEDSDGQVLQNQS